jgi:hypothetical protein
MDGVSPELLEFAISALNLATKSVIDSGGPLVSFSLVKGGQEGQQEGQKGQLTRFVTELLEEGLLKARAKVRDTVGLHRAAVAWDGYLTMDGARTDTVIVEAFRGRGFREHHSRSEVRCRRRGGGGSPPHWPD